MRIRTIKPEFWQNEELARLPAEARLLAIGLLNYCDDYGFFNANPVLLEATVFPFRKITDNFRRTPEKLRNPPEDFRSLLEGLGSVEYCRFFDGTDGRIYGEVINFLRHQKISHPAKSKIKPLQQIPENFRRTLENFRSPPENFRPEQGTGNREQGKEQGVFMGAPPPECADGFGEVLEKWNAMAKNLGLPKVEKLNAARTSHLKARQKEGMLEKLDTILAEIEQSDYLRGGKGWKVNFDWLVENATNWLKVIEGNYRNQPSLIAAPTAGKDYSL